MKKYLKKNVGSLILATVFAIAYAGAFVGISLLLQEIIDIALAGEIRKPVKRLKSAVMGL